MSPIDPRKSPGPKQEDSADSGEFAKLLAESERTLREGELIRGRVVQVTNDEILVDIGYKSEGMIPRHEFASLPAGKLPQPGDEIEAILERTESNSGYVVLSHEKARPEPRLGHGRGGFPDRGVRQGTGARAGEGRARRRHRRPRLPAGLDCGLAAAEEPRRPQGTGSRVPRRRPRPKARQHRPLAQGAPRRDRGREAQGSAGGPRRRPRPQGRRQEHHGLRRVRRPRRHRRPAPRHGHVVGTRRAPLRGREGGRGDRGEGPQVRLRVGTDLARDQAAQARSVARPSGTLPGRRARPRQGRLADGLRRLRGAGRRGGGTDPRQRDVVDEADQEPFEDPEGGGHHRGRHRGRERRDAAPLPFAPRDGGESVGAPRGKIPDRRPDHGDASAT